MMCLVLLFDTTQDGDRVLNAGLVHEHRLETTLQSSILLYVLAILVKGRRAYGMKLATCQCRLDHIARV